MTAIPAIGTPVRNVYTGNMGIVIGRYPNGDHDVIDVRMDSGGTFSGTTAVFEPVDLTDRANA